MGCPTYAAYMTRPDIVNAVREVPRHYRNPSAAHWLAACNILWYLKRTRTSALVSERGHGVHLEVHLDSDYARKQG